MFLKIEKINLGQENLKLFKPGTPHWEENVSKVSLLIVLILQALCNQILLQLVWHHDFLRYQRRTDGACRPVAVLNKTKLDTTASIFS